MFDATDYNLIDETLELHEETETSEENDEDQILEGDSDYFFNERNFMEKIVVPRDMWDDLSQVNPDDLPFNDDFDGF